MPRILLFLAVMAVVATSAAAQSDCRIQPASALRDLLSSVNAERAAAGRHALVLSSQLNRAAQGHACDMVRRDYFSHRSPNNGTLTTRIKAAGYTACYANENIAFGQPTRDRVIVAWMRSSGHRRNILDKRITEVGFGYSGSGGARKWVMVGARPCDARIPRQPAPNEQTPNNNQYQNN